MNNKNIEKATGTVRKIDDLGRIVIPIETLRTRGIQHGDPIEFYVKGGGLILRKYWPGTAACSSLQTIRDVIIPDLNVSSEVQSELLQKVRALELDIKAAGAKAMDNTDTEKATGIVRKIDDLGRIVIPKEIRRTQGLREGDPMEVYDKGDSIILRKYWLGTSAISSISTLREVIRDDMNVSSEVRVELLLKVHTLELDFKAAEEG